MRIRDFSATEVRTVGAIALGLGALLAYWAVSAEHETGTHSAREGVSAPVLLLVGAWLAATGTWGASGIDRSPRWHRAIGVALAIAGLLWGMASFVEDVARWTS